MAIRALAQPRRERQRLTFAAPPGTLQLFSVCTTGTGASGEMRPASPLI
jgi:hypothetical protein